MAADPGTPNMMTMPDLRIELQRDQEELRDAFFSLQSARDVADLLEVPHPYLMRLTSWRANRYAYSTFTIPKRSGGTRTISAPHPTIKILQGKVNEILKLVYEPRASTHGFAIGRNVRTNAERHVRRRWVLNIDLLDFFPSIHFGRIRGVLMKHPYGIGGAAATVLARICSEGPEGNRRLPQGSPASPIISNMICRTMDRELSNLARNSNATYSRYADDITFSTNAPLFDSDIATVGQTGSISDVVIGTKLATIIADNDFRINESKVRVQKRNQHQEVTGITVNQTPNVPRKFIRQIRAMLHDWSVNGYDAAEARYQKEFDRKRGPGRRKALFRDVVYGKISFVKMVKGESDPVYRSLRNRVLRLDGKSVTGDMMEPKRKYDVALSFASAQRTIAAEIAKRVKEAGYSVFYDNDADLWGKELTKEFEEAYRNDARQCVMLVSQEYTSGMWTDYERQQALSRWLDEPGYILPVMVGERVEVPGLPDTIQWLSLNEVGVDGIVQRLIERLSASGGDDAA